MLFAALSFVMTAEPAPALGVTDEPVHPLVTPIAGFAFDPETRVAAGGIVRWRNDDGVAHTVTAVDGSFDSGPIPAGGVFDRSFAAPGEVAYYCAIHPSMTGTVFVADPPAGSPVSGPETSADPDAILLRRTPVLDTDPLGIGGTALSLLVPDGWVVEGGPVWRHHFANLATLEARVVRPDRRSGVEFFPLFPQVWHSGGIPGFPVGSNYLGHEVREPIRDAATFLEALVLPGFRATFSPRVIARESLPDVAAAYVGSSLPGTEVVAERILTEHVVSGEAILEEFVVVLTFTPNPALPGALIWAPQQLSSIRAPATEFDRLRPLLQAVASSPQLDLRWYAGYQQVVDLALRNGLEAIRAAGAASRIVAAANAEISELIIEGHRERQATIDRIDAAVSQTIRGVETYADPFGGGTLELPNGYSYGYASADGSVILTNEPGFDPVRAFPGQTWEVISVER